MVTDDGARGTTDRAVLLVDADGDRARRATAALVDRGPFDVLTADSEAAAVDHLDAGDPVDCVVVAHDEDADGVGVVERLDRRRDAPPVVVVSHAGSEAVATRAVEAGADGYVPGSGPAADDRLAAQVSRAAGEELRRRREAERTRVIDVVREISQSAVCADTRDELESTVCERLAGAGPYLAAVIGSVNPDTGETVPRAWAGVDGVAVERIVGAGGAPTSGLQVEAVRTGRIHVREFEEEEDAALGAVVADGRGPVPVRVERAAAIPITHGERLYGVLSVYADAPHAFDGAELDVLRDLCETTGHAIDGIETRRALERRERELTQKNERLDAFASVVSHDLRNPLDAAKGYVEIAMDRDDTGYLDEALTGIERAKTMVDDLLVLARADREIRETEPVELGAVAGKAWRHVDTGDAALMLECEGTVEADESQLERLLENLFRNCVEHGTGPSGDPVTVTVGGGPGAFFVADDGPGIDPEDREAVFDLGYTTDRDGTGLGLSIVRRIVEAHGWEVAVTGSPSGGARFEVDTDPGDAGTGAQGDGDPGVRTTD